jgi:hypothetical protein
MHHPLFSSGANGNNPHVRPLWVALYAGGVDIVLSGHDHVYERFAEQDPDGRPAFHRGIRQFIVGTGGARSFGFGSPKANSEVQGLGLGVLKLTLRTGAYDWSFLPAEGTAFRDSGSGLCH